MLIQYIIGERITNPRTIQVDCCPFAEATKALEPSPAEDEIVEAVRAGQRPITWGKRSEER